MIYVGTDLKFAINIQCQGFSMDDDEFEITLVNGKNRLELSKDDLVKDNNTWYLCFDSTELGHGDVTMIVCAYVPDADFEDGVRKEVLETTLCQIDPVKGFKKYNV